MADESNSLTRWANAAQAAYALFDSGRSDRSELLEAGKGDFVSSEVARFLGEVPDPYGPSPQGFERINHQSNEPSGFSATVFVEKTTGKYVLAIRGTEEITDIEEDIHRIGVQGFAGDQLVSLYRYYKKLTTPAGLAVRYSDEEVSMLQAIRLGIGTRPLSLLSLPLDMHKLRLELESDVGLTLAPGVRDSIIPAGAPIVVTGHSLGGHLALLFGRFFPEVTEHVYTYNAPGISPLGEITLRAMGIAPIAPSLVTNVSAVMGEEAISRIWSKPGEKIGIATEFGTLLHEHSIVPLTDTLALYGALETLSPGTMNATAVSGIISAASPFPEDRIEKVLDGLGALLDVGNLPTLVARTGEDRAERDDYFRNLYAVLDYRDPERDYQIGSLAGKSSLQMSALAASSDGVIFALDRLIPLYADNADLADFDGSIFTGSWIASRAQMLEGMLENNSLNRPYGTTNSLDSVVYRDIDSGLIFAELDQYQESAALPLASAPLERPRLLAFLQDATYRRTVIFGSRSVVDGDDLAGVAGDDYLYGDAGDDDIDGGPGDDYLEGGAGNDVLVGGAGNDLLDGGSGTDRLEGGPGYDSYLYGAGLDDDTIADRDGRIFAGITPLTGGRGANGNYQSPDGRFSYRLDGDLNAGGTLTINGRLKVENFRNGDLGIRLGESFVPDDAPPPASPGSTLLTGDYDYSGHLDELTHTQYLGFDEYGNPNEDAIASPHPGRVDTYEEFPGTPGATHFVSGGGDDVLQDILGGDDWLELGAGDDAGWGGTGDDTVEGGPGRDIVAGGRGNDVLYAGSSETKTADLDDEAVAASPDAGGLLSGGDGNDFIYGDAGDNLIEGGAGDDLILAGAGDDWIGADVAALAAAERYRIVPPNNDWVNREVDILWNPFQDLPIYALGAPAVFGMPRGASINGRQISATPSSTDGRDYIDAGAGNDTIFAGGGDDFVIGGSGDDYIDPGAGRDTILGGAGRDYIASWFGDSLGDDIEGGDGDDFIADGASEGNRVDGGAGNDYLWSGSGTDLISGGDGNDSLYSFGGDDVLLGGAGDDTVRYGGSGHAILAGGPGDDFLSAGLQFYNGSATLVWAPGDGSDRGLAMGGSVILQLGGAGPGEVSVEYVANVVVPELAIEDVPDATGSGFRFTFDGGADSFLLLEATDYFEGASLSLRFDDGTTWDDAYLRSLAAPPGAPADPIVLGGTGAADVVYGSEGADHFASSGGDDWLVGGAGDDVYEHALGDGFDEIEDSGGGRDALRFSAGIAPADVSVFAAGGDFILAAGEGGVRIRGGRTAAGAIERVEFTDGTLWAPADLEARAELLPANRAPAMPASFGRVAVDPGQTVQVTLPGDAVSDPDRFDAVSLYAITADGERLPGWLNFDAASRTLAGTPAESDAGMHEILFIATDSSGAASAASLTIAVGPDQPAPEAPPASEMPPAASAPPAGGGRAALALDAAAPAASVEPAGRAEMGAEAFSAPALLPAILPPSGNEAVSVASDAAVRVRADPHFAFADSADPAFRAVQHQLDALLQTGRANLGERYAEAVREFEERRLEREEAPTPPPTEEEIEAWNAAMHSWHDRNPGFAETELGTSDGAWSLGWGLPGAQQGALGDVYSGAATPGLANPGALARLQGAAPAPALSEGLSQIRP